MLVSMRVISFCHYLQGPAAAQYLADMGADVIKVEPTFGAYERHWSGANAFVDGISAFYLAANRNKRSLAVDLKHPDGKAVMLRLLEGADVVMENFRPGVMDRLGLGYEQVRAVNPDIIYASATGYGPSGPMVDRPGQDLLIQALSGLIAATGNERPTAIGFAAADQHGAALLAMGILGAYVRRLQTGQGTRIDANLLNAGLDLQTEPLTLYYSGAREPGRVPARPQPRDLVPRGALWRVPDRRRFSRRLPERPEEARGRARQRGARSARRARPLRGARPLRQNARRGAGAAPL